MKRHLTAPLVSALMVSPGYAQLRVDFNLSATAGENAPDQQSSYRRYDAVDQAASFPLRTYSAFGNSVGVQVSFPNTNDVALRRVVNRDAASDAAWGTKNLNLLTDWIGVDSRIQNGTYNGTSGTPTLLTITLSALPPGTYQWTSFHHDTANINTDFQLEVSSNNGATFAPLAGPNADSTFTITDSSTGGNPASSETFNDTTVAESLPSTVKFEFTKAGEDDVILRFAPRSTAEADRAFFIINGFQLALATDSDGDGLIDSEETAAGTRTDLADTDGDGFNDRIEIAAGTSPTIATEFPAGNKPFFISEFLASNASGIDDGNGNRNDWIEIGNPNDEPLSLLGYYLTDDRLDLDKWVFPDVTIPANGKLIVFASQDGIPDEAGNPHTNFRLSSDGEFLALVAQDGLTLIDVFAPVFPEQFGDISYGRDDSGNGLFYFETPTPGGANATGSGAGGVVQDTEFDQDRGFYDDPFSLVLESDTEGAEIRYTLDGSEPTSTSGTVYSSPISISGTSNVRALAYLPGTNWIPTNVDTHTYIFVDQVAQQPAQPAGWASDWGYDGRIDQEDGSGRGDENGIVPADYEMDPRVVNDVEGLRGAEHTMRAALLDIPSVSLTLLQRDIAIAEADKIPGEENVSLYGTPTVTDNNTPAAEKFASIEYILPDGTQGFQEDVIVETHGNSSRTPIRMQKHSLRVSFTTRAGVGKLRYNLFPESPVSTFNKLVLRACFTDSWAMASWTSNGSDARYRPNDSLLMRDVWMKDSFGAMGQPTSYGNFVHLYLNGVYFGVHNLTERIEDDWYAEHLGGEKEDWEINDNLEQVNNPLWREAKRLADRASSSIESFNEAATVIDMENYIDYLILHYYADAEDWPQTNGYGATNAISGDGKFRFNVWDQEIVLDNFDWNYYTDSRGTRPQGENFASTFPGGLEFLERLRRNDEFEIMFIDRVYKHLHDGGALTEANSAARVLEICNKIDKAIIAESARWGDTQANTPYGDTARSSTIVTNDNYPPLLNDPIYFTREQHWVIERDNLINNHIPVLNDATNRDGLIRELQSSPLRIYPRLNVAEFSQFGGVVAPGFELILTDPNAEGSTTYDGILYYTLDGSDPRLPGGDVSPNALIADAPITLSRTGKVRTRIKDGRVWTPMRIAEFIVGIPAAAGNLVISEIMYNPLGNDNEVDLEFIELTNITDTAIDLSRVTLTGAVSYGPFPIGFALAPRSQVVIAQKRSTFIANPLYDTSTFALAPGDYEGRLPNSGGLLELRGESGDVIQSFRYEDPRVAGWASTPDGDGPSLELVDTFAGDNPALPASWRASARNGGNPGKGPTQFPAAPNADFDDDGFSALAEYFFGTSESQPNTNVATFQDSPAGPIFTFGRDEMAIGASRVIEVSNDLDNWTEDMTAFTANPEVVGPDGRIFESYTVNTTETKRFIRVRVIAN